MATKILTLFLNPNVLVLSYFLFLLRLAIVFSKKIGLNSHFVNECWNPSDLGGERGSLLDSALQRKVRETKTLNRIDGLIAT